MLSWLALISIVLIYLSTPTLADTEIRNFAATETPLVDLPRALQLHVLSQSEPHLFLNITSASNISQFEKPECTKFTLSRSTDEAPACPHELWVLLDTDGSKWKVYDKFTLRVSWPAYQPTNVLMDILDPIALTDDGITTNSAPSTTRRKYARLRFVHTGVLSPTHYLQDDITRYLVSFHITLEPLLLGVLPQSLLPVVLSILAIIACGIPISRRIGDHLRKIAIKADEELRLNREKSL